MINYIITNKKLSVIRLVKNISCSAGLLLTVVSRPDRSCVNSCVTNTLVTLTQITNFLCSCLRQRYITIIEILLLSQRSLQPTLYTSGKDSIYPTGYTNSSKTRIMISTYLRNGSNQQTSAFNSPLSFKIT